MLPPISNNAARKNKAGVLNHNFTEQNLLNLSV